MVERTECESLRGRSILVVEDECVIALDLAASLQDEGAVVLGPVSTVRDAWRCIEEHEHIDAAVLDVRLHDDELVFPIADALEERAVPFVFATGCEPDALPERYRTTPALEKPVSTVRIALEMMRRLPAFSSG